VFGERAVAGVHIVKEQSMLKVRRVAGVVAGALLAAAASGSIARADDEVKTVRHDTMNWTFATAVSGDKVVGFLGWVDASEAVLGNIKVMWFERESDGRWTSWAWADNDLGTAVNSVRTLLSDDTVFDQDEDLKQAAWASLDQGFKMPDPVVKGLYADDELQNVVSTSTNPDEMVEWLADAGWPVGKTLSSELAKADKDCQGVLKEPIDGIMDSLANRSETALFGSSDTADPCAALWCKCTTTTTSTLAPPPATWTLTGQTRVAGGWICIWSHPTVVTATSTGEHWYCPSCAGTVTGTGTTTMRTTAIDPDSCLNAPPGGGGGE
jgi:hypothetical protein